MPTWADVAALQAQGRLVFVLDGRVYVLDDSFSHPGGRQVLFSSSGTDVTAVFEGRQGGHAHSAGARGMLQPFCIGELSDGAGSGGGSGGGGGGVPASSSSGGGGSSSDGGGRPFAALIDESQPLLGQVGHLGGAYRAWLRSPAAGQPRFFRSDLAERLTKVRWWVVPLIWLPVAAWFLRRGAAGGGGGGGLAPPQLMALAAAGVVAWQLLEYSIHRWLFHLEPTAPAGIFLHFLLHGCHHKYPTDTERLVFPPLPASWIAALIYLGVRSLLPQPHASALFGGILLGYVAYDCCHYLMHAGLLGGALRAAHMHHHYVDDRVCYGISSPLFDWALSTRARLRLIKRL